MKRVILKFFVICINLGIYCSEENVRERDIFKWTQEERERPDNIKILEKLDAEHKDILRAESDPLYAEERKLKRREAALKKLHIIRDAQLKYHAPGTSPFIEYFGDNIDKENIEYVYG